MDKWSFGQLVPREPMVTQSEGFMVSTNCIMYVTLILFAFEYIPLFMGGQCGWSLPLLFIFYNIFICYGCCWYFFLFLYFGHYFVCYTILCLKLHFFAFPRDLLTDNDITGKLTCFYGYYIHYKTLPSK